MSVLKIVLLLIGPSILIPVTAGSGIPPDVSANYDNNITVSHDGKDNQTCLKGESPCRTVWYALENLRNSTKITITAGVHNLSNTTDLVSVEHFALVGESENATIRCASRAGLSFWKSSDLIFQGIVFEDCGSLRESTTGSGWKNSTKAKFLSGLLLVGSLNLQVDNCTFRSSPGIAVNLFDVGGSVNFSRSWFVGNGPTEARESAFEVVRTGGGVYVEFTDQDHKVPAGNGSNYSFSDCHFINNKAPKAQFESFGKLSSFEQDLHCPFGRGGGISVFLRGKTTNVKVTIDGCIFQGNNASWGGGLFYELHDEAQDTALNIRNSVFQENWVELGGGGARIGSVTVKGSQVLKANKIAVDGCTFIRNRAIFGGGLSYYGPTYLPENQSDRRVIHFANCTWDGNSATAGSALGLNVWLESQIRVHPLVPFYVNLTECRICNNMIIQTEDFVVNGFGALYTNAAHLNFGGSIIFENNTNMTALLLDNAFVYVHDKVTFMGNDGEFGGAVALYGTSRIITWSGSELLFDSNFARSMGGAIYVRAPGPPMAPFKTRQLAIHECFLAFENLTPNDVEHWNTKIIFKNNKARGSAGNSVYATTLQSCYKQNETWDRNDALNWPSVVNFTGSSLNAEVSTDPVSINVARDEWQDLSPSQLFDATIHLTNERNHTSPGAVEIEIISIMNQSLNCNVTLGVPSSLFIIDDQGQITGLKFIGETSCNFSIQLKTPPGQQFLKLAPFKVTLRNSCHPGFEIDPTHPGTCKCMDKKKHRGISRCSEDKKSVYIKKGYWFGDVTDGTYDTYPCPSHHCNKIFTIDESTVCHSGNVAGDFLYDSSTICADHRKGVLCGSCKKGYAVKLGHETCTLANNQSKPWLVPGAVFIICTPIVVLVVLGIPHLDIFVSHLNALLFSWQVMDILKLEWDTLDTGITGLLKLPNWRAPSTGFLLFNGLTDFTKLGINYLLPFYIIVLLGIFFNIAKRRPQCYFAENIFPAFCALIVLCYTDVTDITFRIIQFVQVGDSWVIFSDGDVDTRQPWKWYQILLTVTASLCLVLLIIFPAILLRGDDRINQDRYRFLFNMCDTFSRCYRDGRNGFAAFYFICRIVLIVLSLFLPEGDFLPLKRAILEVVIVSVAVFVLLARPYNGNFSVLNKTDAILMFNLSLITIFSTALQASTDDFRCAGWWIVDILCWTPVLLLFFLMWYHRTTLLEKLLEFRAWICDGLRISRCCRDVEENLIAVDPEKTSTSGLESP